MHINVGCCLYDLVFVHFIDLCMDVFTVGWHCKLLLFKVLKYLSFKVFKVFKVIQMLNALKRSDVLC